MQFSHILPITAILSASSVLASLEFYKLPTTLSLSNLLLEVNVYVAPQDNLLDPNRAALSLADAQGKQVLQQSDGDKNFTDTFPLKYTKVDSTDVYKYTVAKANWTGLDLQAGKYQLILAYAQQDLRTGKRVDRITKTSITLEEEEVPEVPLSDSTDAEPERPTKIVKRTMDGKDIAEESDTKSASKPKTKKSEEDGSEASDSSMASDAHRIGVSGIILALMITALL